MIQVSSLLITIINTGPATVSHSAAFCCCISHLRLLTQGKCITTSGAVPARKRLGSLPGGEAWRSALCIIALNFNPYRAALKCKENKHAEPLAASLAITFFTIGSQNIKAKPLSAKTYI